MPDYVKCTWQVTDRTEVAENFGIRDRMNREIGAVAFCGTKVARLGTDGEGFAWSCEPEIIDRVRYFYTPSARRDGKRYGASHGDIYFDTKEERDAAVTKYIDGARKRAAKIATKK